MYRRSLLLLSLIISLSAVAVSARTVDKAPAWLLQAASVNVPSYEKDVPAVVLLNEQRVMVESDGDLKILNKYAIRILTLEGRGLAAARVFYLASTEKISDFEAWTIDGRGSVREYSKKEMLDIISDPDDVYNEGRVKVIDASGEVGVGSVFGYTVTSEYKPLFYQDTFQFQTRLPTIHSRYQLDLPSGWTANSRVFNHENFEPNVSGTTYIWEMRNLDPIPPEPLSPTVTNLAPFVAVNFTPDTNAPVANKVFGDWKDVSLWATPMYDEKVVLNDEIAAKARELTAGLETELEKIKAIGQYVQNLQYIAIDIGVGHGNGYRPRASDLVLDRGYGDCKDKATLMRAMLKALKIEAYPVAIYSGDPTFVRREWASPRQFNHCIIAIRIGAETHSHAVIEHEQLGRLLMFDSTDDLTPVGDLPSYLQGSNALIFAGEAGSLVEMPIIPAEANGLSRTVSAKLNENGSISGTITELTQGQSSTYERLLFKKNAKDDYRKALEGWLTSGATAARLVSFETNDRFLESKFDLKVDFEAPAYGQLMQNRLLIFRPAIVNRARSIYLTEKDRKTPVQMESTSFVESSQIALPEGFSVDEIPENASIETPFGSYSTKFEIKDGKLLYERRMQLENRIVPAEKYSTVRDFFSKVLDAEQAVVVLIRD
ncbi:MAG: DUF3857 domain-containing protein [Acidobacteria bacterium]|nr:MAG: DUF3857 domain-containing protein [Acidobacteriota bacterium]REK02365.1 MAG: DUF3857 domain-containing protein [Acidobacteriota bacterium]REK13833.1 MAG: DUF3857 domain-containing protein [Acidobacteriota bacterium]REK41828.1 MAG: DUF3857 domain-containing protein [Acidobacteriota bacterium]